MRVLQRNDAPYLVMEVNRPTAAALNASRNFAKSPNALSIAGATLPVTAATGCVANAAASTAMLTSM